MVYNTLANMEFADILYEAKVNTQTGEELLNKYKEFLLANPVSCGLINQFVHEAKNYAYDSGVAYVLENVCHIIEDNKISWQLATACENVNRNTSAYNYLNRNAAKQVETLLEMDESNVVKYVKAGALKNVMFVEAFRNVVKQCYKDHTQVEVCENYRKQNPLSIIEECGTSMYFQVKGNLYKMDTESNEVFESNWNEVSNDFKVVTNLMESNILEYANDTFSVKYNNATYSINEQNKCTRTVGEKKQEFTNESLREHNRLMLNTVTPNKRNQTAALLESIAVLCENYDRMVELNNVKIIESANDLFYVIESNTNLVGKLLRSNHEAHVWSINENIVESINFIKEHTKINLNEEYSEAIDKAINEACEEEKQEIKENLEADAIQERRNKIEQLTEQFKNDPVKLAVLSQLASDLNSL